MRLIALVLLAILIALAAWPDASLFNAALPQRADYQRWIDSAGILGPVLVVTLMTVAIVATPIPSAPVALAAGAAYGHTAGTALVVAGAEVGALMAFLIARGLGRSALQKWLGEKIDAGLLAPSAALPSGPEGAR